MSQLSDSVKAKRKARRTGGDREMNQKHGKGKENRGDRHAAKKEVLAGQGKDVDFDTFGKGHVSGKEVQAMKNSGMSAADIQSKVSESGGEVGGRAQKKLDRYAKRASAKERANGQPAAPAPAPPPPPAAEPPATPPAVTKQKVEVHQAQTQNANQDNDINNEINGDNNNVNINQDNSVRQYGGVNKSFVYNSANGNNYNDTPVSAATMGEYYHDDDTPASTAAFVDRYTTMNADAQKKYANPNHAQNAINMAASNKAIDVNELDQRIADRTEATRARSTVMAGDIFGDMFNHTPKDFNTDYDDDDE